MFRTLALLEKLADGKTHSGEVLAAQLGITRAAVWNQVKRLQEEGVVIHAISGKGYRLPSGFEFLDVNTIRKGLSASANRALAKLSVEKIVDSTNERLLQQATKRDIHGSALLAEFQTKGRGRRGGDWLAPPGSGLCLSLGWRFDPTPASLSALSLAVGVGVARALQSLGARGIALKWPNDVYHGEKKLAGILIEMRSEVDGPCTLVIGLGLNIALSPHARGRIALPSTDLAAACDPMPSRNATAAAILDNLHDVLKEFARSGFETHRCEWQALDLLQGRPIRLQLAERCVTGVARGVRSDGTLRIETGDSVEVFHAGHVEMEPPATCY